MRLRFFSVPAREPAAEAEEVNQFLASHRVLAVDRHLVADGPASFWAICVNYLDRSGAGPLGRKGKIDYREVLPEEQFAVFVRLRALRKQIAESEGVPAYALFTNEQLAAMVRQGMRTAEDLAQLEGVGPARVEKYGAAFLEVLRAGNPGAGAPAGSESA